MPRIVAVGHAFPANTVGQAAVRDFVGRHFSGLANLESALAVFRNARIRTRNLMMPLAWYGQRTSGAEANRVYQEQGLELCVEAVGKCLTQAAMAPRRVDHVVFVSSTGHATPTMDARLINRLGLKRHVSRLPIWGLGCAAGAAGLSRCADYCRAHPDRSVLLVALECCSLAYMGSDISKKNLIATSLFGDGAAAVLVAGDRAVEDGPQICASRSHLFPDSYDLMGWDFLDEGMQLVLSPKLPAVIRRELPSLVAAFLAEHGLEHDALRHYVTHPGGARVIDAYQDALGLHQGELRITEEVLADHGNMSSVSVLVVLERWLASPQARQAGHGLLSAFGPGFSAELLLLRV